MSPGGHLVTTAVACGAAYAATGSAELTAGLAAGGFAIDLDHALDYVVFERRRDWRPGAFMRYYLDGRMGRTVLILHSYELTALLALVAWLWASPILAGYVLGAALHLPLDVAFNGRLQSRSLIPFYSLVHRWRHGFRASDLLSPVVGAHTPEGFWAAFFRGRVPEARPAPRAAALADRRPPAPRPDPA